MSNKTEILQGRYKPNPEYGGRKERDGFVCGNPTGKKGVSILVCCG